MNIVEVLTLSKYNTEGRRRNHRRCFQLKYNKYFEGQVHIFLGIGNSRKVK